MTTLLSESIIEQHLQDLTRQCEELRRERDELKAFIRWEDTLFAVPQEHMSAAQKITHRYLMQTYIGRPIDGTDRRQVETWEVAKLTGRSVSGVRADIKHLVEELGLYQKSRVNEYHEDAPPITHMFLAPVERGQYPRLYRAEHPSQHGGTGRQQGRGGKKQCENCGSEELDLYQNYQCRKCNHIGTVEITHQHSHDHTPPPSPSSPTPNNQLDFREDVSEEEEPSEPEEPEQSTIIDSSLVSVNASPSSPTPNNQLDFREEQPPNNQLASLITYKRDVQLDCSDASPSSPTPNNQLDFREDEDVDTSPPPLTCSLLSEPPAFLRDQVIWCCHRAKRPYCASTDYPASVTDEQTWGTYAQAIAKYERSQSYACPYDGVGLMCNSTFTVNDEDHCIDAQGRLDERAAERAILSYAERSFSGTGKHTFVLGTIPRNIKRTPLGIEMYDHARFIVWTGQHIEGTPLTLENKQAELTALFQCITPPIVERAAIAPSMHGSAVQSPCLLTDEQIIQKAIAAKNGAKFAALWRGDTSGYQSHSEADAALYRMLCYWTDGDVSTVERLFALSQLVSHKWEREDYRAKTRAYALQ